MYEFLKIFTHKIRIIKANIQNTMFAGMFILFGIMMYTTESIDVKNIKPTKKTSCKDFLIALMCKPIPKLAAKITKNCKANILIVAPLSLLF